jgi:bacterioferritin (cytochrome b1)
MSADMMSLLENLRRAEKEQALLYRRLAALAEEREDELLAQRFHDLHADEQHHLSRLTARLLELGGRPADLADVRPAVGELYGWEDLVRTREAAEIQRYTSALQTELDPHSRTLLSEILGVEEHHAADLGGKWTLA